MEITELGMEMLVRLLQPLKAYLMGHAAGYLSDGLSGKAVPPEGVILHERTVGTFHVRREQFHPEDLLYSAEIEAGVFYSPSAGTHIAEHEGYLCAVESAEGIDLLCGVQSFAFCVKVHSAGLVYVEPAFLHRIGPSVLIGIVAQDLLLIAVSAGGEQYSCQQYDPK